MHTVAMMLRFWHLKSDSKRWATAKLGNFRVIGTRNHAKVTVDLYMHIIEVKGILKPGPLLGYLHHLLDALVRTKILADDRMACPTDQAACLVSMRSHARFQLANPFTSWCAKLQHCMFDISAHIIRLEFGDHDDYVPHGSKKAVLPDVRNEDVVREVDDQSGASDSDSDSDETSDSEDEESDHSTSHSGLNGGCDPDDSSDCDSKIRDDAVEGQSLDSRSECT
jgi:Cft2 family RNA processing exonuclease